MIVCAEFHCDCIGLFAVWIITTKEGLSRLKSPPLLIVFSIVLGLEELLKQILSAEVKPATKARLPNHGVFCTCWRQVLCRLIVVWPSPEFTHLNHLLFVAENVEFRAFASFCGPHNYSIRPTHSKSNAADPMLCLCVRHIVRSVERDVWPEWSTAAIIWRLWWSIPGTQHIPLLFKTNVYLFFIYLYFHLLIFYFSKEVNFSNPVRQVVLNQWLKINVSFNHKHSNIQIFSIYTSLNECYTFLFFSHSCCSPRLFKWCCTTINWTEPKLGHCKLLTEFYNIWIFKQVHKWYLIIFQPAPGTCTENTINTPNVGRVTTRTCVCDNQACNGSSATTFSVLLLILAIASYFAL